MLAAKLYYYAHPALRADVLAEQALAASMLRVRLSVVRLADRVLDSTQVFSHVVVTKEDVPPSNLI